MRPSLGGFWCFCILMLLVSLFVMACESSESIEQRERQQELGRSMVEPKGEGPKLRCVYYPDYDRSLLYIEESVSSGGGVTGEFWKGDICVYESE